MQKIPTLFVRNSETHRVTPVLTPGCEWVLDGEGIPTRKVDGTSVMLRDGKAYKRREVKPRKRTPPDFELAQEDTNTGKKVGWVPINPSDPSDQHHIEGIRNAGTGIRVPGVDGDTYELVGPKIQQNTEGLEHHTLIRHDDPALHLTEQIRTLTGSSAEKAFEILDA